METFYQILGLLGAVLIVVLLYRGIKNKPELFTKENLNQSFYSMGILALCLIGFVALLVFFLRSS